MIDMDGVDFVLSDDDRIELLECVTLLREAGLEEIAQRIEAVLKNLVEVRNFFPRSLSYSYGPIAPCCFLLFVVLREA
jgi:hypothetical protein